MFTKLRTKIVSVGLDVEQRKILAELSQKQYVYNYRLNGFDDDAFTHLEMCDRAAGIDLQSDISVAGAYLYRFCAETDKLKNEIERLVEKCRQIGISEWRIGLVLYQSI